MGGILPARHLPQYTVIDTFVADRQAVSVGTSFEHG